MFVDAWKHRTCYGKLQEIDSWIDSQVALAQAVGARLAHAEKS